MAYTPNTLHLITGRFDSAARVWFYRTTDAMTTVRAANYIGDAKLRRMMVGDVVHVQTVNGSGVPTAHNIAVVMAVADTGADLSDGTAISVTNT